METPDFTRAIPASANFHYFLVRRMRTVAFKHSSSPIPPYGIHKLSTRRGRNTYALAHHSSATIPFLLSVSPAHSQVEARISVRRETCRAFRNCKTLRRGRQKGTR